MTTHSILDIDQDLRQYRSRLGTLLNQIVQLSAKTSNAELVKTVNAVKYNIDKPFMFVVMGEVKAGKSSFVNALLDGDVCATDVKPCTDRVQVLCYSNEPYIKDINIHLVEIGKPIEILREISIVDTPGTNSVIKDHQLITSDFIPSCDLAFFVFFARNPYFESTWNFLDHISGEWGKKIVLILQQADLLRPQELLDENISEVKKMAEAKGIKDPIVFATSAELEKNGDIENSGFMTVKNYIKDLVTTQEIYTLKLKTSNDTVRKIVDDLGRDVDTLTHHLEADKKAVKRVKARFIRGRNQSLEEVIFTGDRVAERYGSISERIKEEFRQEVSFLSVVKGTFTFSLKRRLEGFSDRCKAEVEDEIQDLAQERAAHILDGIRQFGEDLKYDLNMIREELEVSSLSTVDHGQVYIKILERRQALLDNIKQKVETILGDERWVESLNSGVEGAALGTGGAVAVIAVVITQIIEIVFANFALLAFEAAFAGIGLVIFAVGFAWRRGTLIHKFEQALDDGQRQLKEAVTQRLTEKLDLIYQDLERECSRFYDNVAQQEQEIQPLLQDYSDIKESFAQLSSQANTLLN